MFFFILDSINVIFAKKHDTYETSRAYKQFHFQFFTINIH
jgi:hypothetical protein